jgi:hypothetical protein
MVLTNELREAGTHHDSYNVADELSNGLYIVQLVVGNERYTKKVVKN